MSADTIPVPPRWMSVPCAEKPGAERLTKPEAAPALPFIDLQWFAAEDEGRTEQPSEYKLRKAREEGK